MNKGRKICICISQKYFLLLRSLWFQPIALELERLHNLWYGLPYDYIWFIQKWELVLRMKYVLFIKKLKSGPLYVLLSTYGLIFSDILVLRMN